MSVCGILIPTIFFFLIEYILVYYYDANNNKYSYLEVILYGLY